MARFVDVVVVARLLAALSPDKVGLALAAADEVAGRQKRNTRAFELQVERARYDAGRAERAFHLCEPEDRLVARTLERRWEDKLVVLTEAEAALATAQEATVPLPPRVELEALASDVPSLWSAPTTSIKDRKRILRTLVAEVTLTSEPGARVRVGIRWRTGASEEAEAFRAKSQ